MEHTHGLKDLCNTCSWCYVSVFPHFYKTVRLPDSVIKTCTSLTGGMRARIGSKGFTGAVVKCSAWSPPRYMTDVSDLEQTRNPVLLLLKKQLAENVLSKEQLEQALVKRQEKVKIDEVLENKL